MFKKIILPFFCLCFLLPHYASAMFEEDFDCNEHQFRLVSVVENNNFFSSNLIESFTYRFDKSLCNKNIEEDFIPNISRFLNKIDLSQDKIDKIPVFSPEHIYVLLQNKIHQRLGYLKKKISDPELFIEKYKKNLHECVLKISNQHKNTQIIATYFLSK